LLKLLLVFAKNYRNTGFSEKRQFSKKNWQKSRKIVITTSTAGHIDCLPSYLNKAEVVTPDEAGEAAAQCPREQDIGRLPDRLVDFRLQAEELAG
jgi:hypothetical protein